MAPCRVFERPPFLVRTDLNESGPGPHPHTIVEIVTGVSLRQTYGLVDGSLVDVEI
jgi:riboflavin kinase, archaea type